MSFPYNQNNGFATPFYNGYNGYSQAVPTPAQNLPIPADGGKYWTFGTSEGKFGEFAKWGDTFFSVNKGGFLWAKAGTEKGEKFVEMINDMLNQMSADHRPIEDEEDVA